MSTGRSEPKVVGRERRVSGKAGSNQSQKPPMMTEVTKAGVQMVANNFSRRSNASWCALWVGATVHFRTCWNVSSWMPQPGHASDLSYKSLFWRLVLVNWCTILVTLMRWKRVSRRNTRWCESQSTLLKVVIFQPVLGRMYSTMGWEWWALASIL